MLLKELVFDLKESDAYMTLMYDETTANQKFKQMDVYVRYWDSAIGGIET